MAISNKHFIHSDFQGFCVFMKVMIFIRMHRVVLISCESEQEKQEITDINRKLSPGGYNHKTASLAKHNQKMGSIFSNFLASFSNMKAKILMLGLDAAGKTTILYQFKLNDTVQSVPTIGFNVEEVNYKNLKFTIWDIGGQTKLRSMWHYYYEGGDAVVYVLDSSDTERIQLAKQTLDAVINHESMKNVPVLVFANKMDIATLQPRELVEKLGLHQMRRQWHLQPCCAINGDGLVQGFEWLRNQIKSGKK